MLCPMSAAQSSLLTHWIGYLYVINSSGQNHPQENCLSFLCSIGVLCSNPFDHMGKDITSYANCHGAHVHIYNDVVWCELVLHRLKL
ncbi:hypothetical protein E1A91_A05G420300v1 [Gossypium mustelinum]|uniref:Uncharacterized protein n=2 Tax=Gossypium TaxID=3633 RepID=A0A5D2ZHJ4_GOSMU|nr:hypothetical protein ES332_A05G436600v1 [Gossypium tomentosum]TYJ38098.1 hypothetical protein E1A91_A05G420300v1 [Gossypium mustelinum]